MFNVLKLEILIFETTAGNLTTVFGYNNTIFSTDDYEVTTISIFEEYYDIGMFTLVVVLVTFFILCFLVNIFGGGGISREYLQLQLLKQSCNPRSFNDETLILIKIIKIIYKYILYLVIEDSLITIINITWMQNS